jgi:RND family efflux transporter MFP subunit
MSARMSAAVQEVFVSAGDRVKAGQILLTLDDRELREQLTAGEAQLSQAAAEFRRARQLFERNATTEQALTAAESAFNTAKANVDRIKIMLTYATVASPIDGIVTERRIEAGDLANPGQILLAIFDPANMRLEVPVPVRLISKFTLGQELVASLEYPAKSYAAVVTEIVGEIDPLSRTRRVKLRLNDTQGDVLPGTFGRIWVEEEARPAVFIPAEAISRVGQLDQVQVVKDDRMIRRLIKTGREQDGQIEVLSGLSAGDRIVIPSGKEG